MSEYAYTVVAPADSIEEKKIHTFEVDGVGIAICCFRDEYFAIENRCSHALSTFDDGHVRGYRITCPLHGATFDVRDGSVTGAPAKKPIRSFPVRITNGMIEVDLSSVD